MHYNLIFNGCSFTFGSELEGIDEDREYLKTHRFSHLVAKELDMTYENISFSGASNDFIVETTINWFESGNTCDTAIIQFTRNTRTIWYDENNNNLPCNISPMMYIARNNKGKMYLAKNLYYKSFYSPFLGDQNFYKNLFFLEKYLTEKNIKYIFTQIPNATSNSNTDCGWRKHCSKISVYPLDKILGPKTNYKESIIVNENYCKDFFISNSHLRGIHPSAIGHQKIANYIIENIKS